MSSKTEKMKQQAEGLKQKIRDTEKNENEKAGRVLRKHYENEFKDFNLENLKNDLTKIFA